jgi:mersacidin/lichenicidin family type 2 lantibiotic
MSKENIIRAWKDPEYRSSLNAQEHASLPANPAGTLDDEKLAEVAGGLWSLRTWYVACTNKEGGGDCFSTVRVGC